MKITYQPRDILKEMNNLISYSCNNEAISTNRFATFHKALIKKHFEASEVEINLNQNNLFLKIPIEANRYATINFEFKDFEALLKSCIEDDLESLFFYQNMLSFYNVAAA